MSEAAVAPELSPQQLDRRQRIIDVAFELGAAGGYDAVQMRDVAASANVAMATIYRYFSSKDHLLAAAMSEWTARLGVQIAKSPPRGATEAERMIDVLQRACRAMEQQPKLAVALVRSLAAADPGVQESGAEVQREIAALGSAVLVDLDEERRADVLAVIGHVWYSSLTSWVNGRRDFDSVIAELARAVRTLMGA